MRFALAHHILRHWLKVNPVNPNQPPYTITPKILNRVAAIGEAIGRLTGTADQAKALRLRRANRIRAIQGSLAIEGNTLSEAQITAILEGRRVIAPPREVLEVKNDTEKGTDLFGRGDAPCMPMTKTSTPGRRSRLS